MSTTTIRNLTFLAGSILFLLAIFYMPQSGNYSSKELTFATFFSVAAMTSAVFITFVKPHINQKKVNHVYSVLEEHKLWKISNKLILGLVFLASIIFSAIFVKKQGDFFNFVIIMSTIVLCLGFIQYFKAIPILKKEY